MRNHYWQILINPADDAQFNSWEFGVQNWIASNTIPYKIKPTQLDDIHTQANQPKISVVSPGQNLEYSKDNRVSVIFSTIAHFPIARASFYLNNELVGTSDTFPFVISFVPSSTNSFIIGTNELKVIVYDNVYNEGETTISIKIK